MAFWDSISGFLGDVNDTVGSLADTYNTLGQMGIVDIGPSAGSSGGFGGTTGTTGDSFGDSWPPPYLPFMGSGLADPAAPAAPPQTASTPAFVWIAGAVALVWLVKK